MGEGEVTWALLEINLADGVAAYCFGLERYAALQKMEGFEFSDWTDPEALVGKEVQTYSQTTRRVARYLGAIEVVYPNRGQSSPDDWVHDLPNPNCTTFSNWPWADPELFKKVVEVVLQANSGKDTGVLVHGRYWPVRVDDLDLFVRMSGLPEEQLRPYLEQEGDNAFYHVMFFFAWEGEGE